MDILSNFIKIVSIGIICIIIGKVIKDKFIKWVGIIVCILVIVIPFIAAIMGFIDGYYS